ncbi:XRE family transcriptional regulator [Spirabiliibacterium falconis]|uniref:XRE family transcriptional regulator n=1 Tax=Spirabiliibacterium falconis TaxID=572023 RepID=UPI001AACD2E1|nr:S24 family peptidase [Spirabiliibacterium falconis]MBE2895191.1 helix-turn-helix transcriptional regulator [Spirabiliibacterium falconis]
MTTLAERLQYAMQLSNMNQIELGAAVGVSQAAIHKILKGDTKNPKNILQLAKVLNVSAEWLSTGTGDMGYDFSKVHNVSVAEEVDDDLIDNYIRIDLYDVKLSAGKGNLAWFINDDDPVLLRRSWFRRNSIHPDTCKAMYVKGSSMTPELENGDTVIIDTADTDIEDGEIYAVSFKQRLFIKRIIRTEDGIRLISAAEGYEPIDIDEDMAESSDFHILGRKVWRGG